MCIILCPSVVQGTVEKQQLQRRLCVGEFQLTFIAGFPQTDFDTKLVDFFLKLVLPDSKGITVKFSHFYFTFISKIVT